LGPPGPGREPIFATAEEARQAWQRVRDNFPLPHNSPGRRPWAWWCFEPHEIAWPGYDAERSTLFTHGLVSDEEKAQLLADWKGQFDKAQARGFALTLGPGEVLYGAAARRAHYEWADIPAALVKQWTAEHRRRKQTIRDLATMAAPGP
jgi:hypothetical protein